MELHFLIDYHPNRIGTSKGKQDFDRAFPPLYLVPTAAILVLCVALLERLGSEFFGRLVHREIEREMGLSKRQSEGVKRLRRSAEHATAEFALLHERGDDVSFVDRGCVAAGSGFGAWLRPKLGECYEYGKMGYLRSQFSPSTTACAPFHPSRLTS